MKANILKLLINKHTVFENRKAVSLIRSNLQQNLQSQKYNLNLTLKRIFSNFLILQNLGDLVFATRKKRSS